MRRFSTVIWILVIAVAVFLLYLVKYQVQSLKTQVAETSRELEAEKEALHVVTAEWAYLNRPERLQSLADRYLSPAEATVDRVADVEEIPFPTQSQAALAPEDITPVSAGGDAR